MELQRLVVEEGHQVRTVDFHGGLTVAFHENPAVRAGFIAEVVGALGPARDGVHLELVDDDRSSLAVFRPFGNRHRVVDIDRRADVSAQFASPGERVDILGRSGLDPTEALQLMRLGADQINSAASADPDEQRRARALAAAGQAELWTAADRLDAAERRLGELSRSGPPTTGEGEGTPGGAIGADPAAEGRLRARSEQLRVAEREHRRVLVLGGAVTALCAAAGLFLLFVDDLLDDRAFTARALLLLAVVAGGITVADRRHVLRARRAVQEAGVAAGAAAAEQGGSAEAAGAVPGATRAAAADSAAAAHAHAAAVAEWRRVAGDTPVGWALAHRGIISRLAEQRAAMTALGAGNLAGADGTVADSARVLVNKVIDLAEAGVGGRRLPLLLDEPFVGFAPADVERLLELLLRLSAGHQVVLVSGDASVRAWAARAGANAVGLVRIERPANGSPASPATDAPSPAAR